MILFHRSKHHLLYPWSLWELSLLPCKKRIDIEISALTFKANCGVRVTCGYAVVPLHRCYESSLWTLKYLLLLHIIYIVKTSICISVPVDALLSDSPPQDDSLQAVMPCCQPTSIPLLMACTANVKTVVANPIVYLTNLAHDILQTINSLDSPPHPDVVNNEVRVDNISILQIYGCHQTVYVGD